MTESRRHGGKTWSVVIVLLMLVGVACRATSDPDPGVGSDQVQVGELAPAFTLPSAQGGTVSLADFTNRQPVLLYFSMGPG